VLALQTAWTYSSASSNFWMRSLFGLYSSSFLCRVRSIRTYATAPTGTPGVPPAAAPKSIRALGRSVPLCGHAYLQPPSAGADAPSPAHLASICERSLASALICRVGPWLLTIPISFGHLCPKKIPSHVALSPDGLFSDAAIASGRDRQDTVKPTSGFRRAVISSKSII